MFMLCMYLGTEPFVFEAVGHTACESGMSCSGRACIAFAKDMQLPRCVLSVKDVLP